MGAKLDEAFEKAARKMEDVDFERLGNQISRTVNAALRQANRAWQSAKSNVQYHVREGDYHFAGSGVLDGGTYNDLTFAGSGKIAGDVQCRNINIGGSFKAEGSIDCRNAIRGGGSFKATGDVTAYGINIGGSFKAEGDVKAETFRCGGSTIIGGSFSGSSLSTPGALTIRGDATAREVRVGGSANIGGSCEAEYFSSTGRLTVGGLLNADTVEIRLGMAEESTVGDIGCTNLTVSRGRIGGFVGDVFGDAALGTLKVGTIEGDNITLEYTEADTIRGTNVTIGMGCKIGTVEYDGNCEICPDAQVETCTKV
jgi:cytoskeletal protein CcmA (bactofilin family)